MGLSTGSPSRALSPHCGSAHRSVPHGGQVARPRASQPCPHRRSPAAPRLSERSQVLPAAPTTLPGITTFRWEIAGISASRPRGVPPLSPHEKALATQAPGRNSTAQTAEGPTGPGTAFKRPRAPLGPRARPLPSRVRHPTASHRPGGDRTRKMGQQAQGGGKGKGGEKKKTTNKQKTKQQHGRENPFIPCVRARGGSQPGEQYPTARACRARPRPTEPPRPETYLTLIRYWAKLMLAADPVMVTCLSVDPSTGLAILICAPDIWRISLILAP